MLKIMPFKQRLVKLTLKREKKMFFMMNEKNVSHYGKKGAMSKRVPGHRYFYVTLFTLVLAFFNLPSGQAADHGDHIGEQRGDGVNEDAKKFARITGLHAFFQGENGENLVIALSSYPEIPFADDNFPDKDKVIFTIRIDNNNVVRFDDCCNNAEAEFGGTVKTQIKEDIIFTITFEGEGHMPYLTLTRFGPDVPADKKKCTMTGNDIKCFAGLRDDPFIRNKFNGENVAAIVLEFPLNLVTTKNSRDTLLIWATSHIIMPTMPPPLPEAGEAGVEHAGRALRSQLPEFLKINTLHPSEHVNAVPSIKEPDVMICNTSRIPSFPNCRGLTDDVVQYLVCNDFIAPPPAMDAAMMDGFFPKSNCYTVRENDKPFLKEFPYLAEPHPMMPTQD
jgi:hypothetical protein